MKDGMEVGKHDQKETNLSQPNMSAARLWRRKAHQSGTPALLDVYLFPSSSLLLQGSPSFPSPPSFFSFIISFANSSEPSVIQLTSNCTHSVKLVDTFLL